MTSAEDRPFVDRTRELRFLDGLIGRRRPGPGQLILVYGRRRIGKSRLLRHWAARSEVRWTVWTADKESASRQRRQLFARLRGVRPEQAPVFGSWSDLWAAAADLLAGERRVLVLDELPWAIEADPAMLSSLQTAWDERLRDLDLVVALCGSHVRTMEALLERQSPLFGRLTGQWRLEPLPFAALEELLPDWSMQERVRAWAVVGGVPAYLEWLDPERGLLENLRDVVLAPGSMFVAEPMFLLMDEVRELRNYLATIKAIGAGAHDLGAIHRASLLSKTHLSAYLSRLQELGLVERRLPATLTPAGRSRSRRGRYHLSDAWFRFYFRFLAPFADTLAFDRRPALERIRGELEAFVGATAFEDLAQRWVRARSAAGELPSRAGQVGAHWSRKVQADVVAVDHEGRNLLVGECRWRSGKVGLPAVRKLVEETIPAVLADLGGDPGRWLVTPAFFCRSGFTGGAEGELRRRGGVAVDLEQLEAGLRAEP